MVDFPPSEFLAHLARRKASSLMRPAVLDRLRPQAITQAASRAVGTPRRQVEAATPLTKRERAVPRLLASQLSNREIGRELYVSVNTVRTHVQAVYRELEVASRAEAVGHARHLRLLPGATPTDR